MDKSQEFSSLYSALLEQERREIHARLVEIFALAMLEKTDISVPFAIRVGDNIEVRHDMFSAMLNIFSSSTRAEFELLRALRMRHEENVKKCLDLFKLEVSHAYANAYAPLMAELKVINSIHRTLGTGDTT